jgi:hypothetical protein
VTLLGHIRPIIAKVAVEIFYDIGEKQRRLVYGFLIISAALAIRDSTSKRSEPNLETKHKLMKA